MNTKKVIARTNSVLDGTEVTIVGIAQEFMGTGDKIYIIEKNSGVFDNGFKCMTLTEHCLENLSILDKFNDRQFAA